MATPETTAEFEPGALVTPSIRLERQLGRGGMGSVWIAEHLQLKTQVVVKFMTAERRGSEEALQRFRREAELSAQAKSPHVVQVFDHGVSQLGVPYIAMEFLEGEDLGKRIAREGPVEPKLFSGWLSQACRGLARAHAKGIVHRDIKPENIFLCDNDGEVLVKVLDFGVAKSSGKSGFLATRTGAILGTPYYMSPEQAMGKKDIDPRSDLWSLAVVTFYALTGARAFTGDGIGDLIVSVSTAPLPLPSAKDPTLTPQIDAWMMKALSRPREARFQTAKELAQEFAQAVGLVSAGAADRSTSWPGSSLLPSLPTQSPPQTSRASGLAASTMSPSVRAGDPARSSAGETSAPTKRNWILAALGGAALGLLVVMAILRAERAPPALAPAAAGSSMPAPPPVSVAPVAPVATPAKPTASASASAASVSQHPPSVAPSANAPQPKTPPHDIFPPR